MSIEVKKVKEAFESIKATTKRTEKESMIESNKDNELFVDTLVFLCDPYITTGLSTSKISKDIEPMEVSATFKEAMDYIKVNNTGRDEDIAFIKGFINTMDEELREFLLGIFSKSFTLGAGASSINKVIPNLIKEFDVMLAESYDKNKAKVEGKEFIITYKLDGMRIICINEKGKSASFYTRQGHTVEGLVELEEAFLDLPSGVYDGELIADGKFYTSKELFQETMKRARIKGEKKGLRMYCFDFIENVEDFYNGIDNTKAFVRKQKLLPAIQTNIKPEYINRVKYLNPIYVGSDTDKIAVALEYATKAKQEGLMINISDAPYECKRTKSLLKVKVFSTVDLKVIGYEEGSGEFEGTLGALLVDYKDNTVKVGSGFTIAHRKEIWDNKEDIIGKIVEIQFFEETQNQNGGISLRFPVFLRVRDDKTEPSLH